MNPELQRNLWLMAPRRRLLSSGMSLGLIFALVWLVDRGRHAYAIVTAGALVFGLGALVWAPRAARASVIDEVHARTWDSQRLTALSPWEMTWGKLAGVTSRHWLFASVGLGVALLQYASLSSVTRALFWLLIAVAAALLMQAAGLAASLIEVRRARVLARRPGGRPLGLALLALTLLGLGCLVWARGHAVWRVDIAAGVLASAGRPVQWWGRPQDPAHFAAASLMLFAAGSTACAWRLMRDELQGENLCWAWTLFVTVAGLYVAGFGPGRLVEHLRLAALAWALCAYVGSFLDPADRVRARRFASAVRRLDLGRMARGMPLMLAPTQLMAVALGLAAVMSWRNADADAALFDLGLCIFVLRDLGLITALRFEPNGWRGDFGVLLSLALAYGIGSALGQIVGGSRGAALAFPSMGHLGVSLGAGTLEAVLAWAFAARQISRPAKWLRPLPPPASPPLQTTPPVTSLPGTDLAGAGLAGPAPPSSV